jgi:DNA repair exonuclease SbcCD ATPase subunit
VIEHLDRTAANRDEVDQIAQIVETERDRTANMVAILTGLMSDFEQHKKSAVSHEQLAQLARQVEAQSARIDGVEKAGAANPQGEAPDVNERIAELHKLISDNAQNLESSIKQQAGSVQSLRGAIAQTDDTVERVIEALESLQESIIEHNTNGRDG